MTDQDGVSLELWKGDDQNLQLLRRSNAPQMMTFLGGPETEQKVVDRNAKYLRLTRSGEARMFAIVTDSAPQGVGGVGYWQSEWDGEPVYELGWGVEPDYQGHGIAARAVQLCVADALAQPDRRKLVAFPRVDHEASNAVARSAGFTLIGPADFEYPPGNPIVSNVWLIEP